MRPSLVPIVFSGERRVGVGGGGGQEGNFDPSTVSGLVYDYRSDMGLFTTSGGATQATANDDPVGEWRDQSGNANHLLQASGTARPLLKTGTLPSGKGDVVGDGVDDFLRDLFTLNQPAHIFVVIRQVSWSANDRTLDGGNALARLMQSGSSPTLAMSAGSSLVTSDVAVGTAAVVSMLFNGASSEMRVNGGAPVTGDAGAANPGGLTLFASNANAGPANVGFGRAIGFNVALNDTDRQYIENGLKAWAGIA